jgi:hypothetical protein
VPPSYLMRDVVVCIPGITGSVLRKDNKDVWNISGGAVLNALRSLGRSMRDLTLEDDPVDVDDVDGITATSVIRDVHLIPGIWKIDGYTKLVRHIEQHFDVKPGENLFEFAYDWRRDNGVASRQLATKAKGWLDAYRQKSGNANAKLIVIGHSMGGLVARHFIECREGWRDTKALVTIGTPYRGSIYSLGTLVNGKKIKFFDLTEMARSMTAIYQLLPTYECYDGGAGGRLVKVTDAQIPNLDGGKAKAAAAFHEEIRAAVEENMKDQKYADSRYDLRPIVGIEQPMAQSAVLDGNRVKLLRPSRREEFGDGTVPRLSATPPEFRRLENSIYAAERHASLQNDDDVLFQLRGILTQPDFSPEAHRAATAKVGQSLDVEDWIDPEEPLRVRVQPHDDAGGMLVALAEDAETGEERARQRLREADDGWYEAELGPLPEGLYRVTSMGGTVEPVTDLVTVVGE